MSERSYATLLSDVERLTRERDAAMAEVARLRLEVERLRGSSDDVPIIPYGPPYAPHGAPHRHEVGGSVYAGCTRGGIPRYIPTTEKP